MPLRLCGLIDPMNFNPETALKYAASIARPRRVGCGEDEVVANEIADRLRQFGYRVERQPFEFSTAPNTFLTMIILVDLLLVLAILMLRASMPFAASIAAVLMMLSIVLFSSINRIVQSAAIEMPVPEHPLRRIERRSWRSVLSKRHTTANFIGTRPVEDDGSLPHLYLVAHYDSKSQRMPLAIRIMLFMVAIGASLIVAVLTLFNALTPIANAASIIAMLAGLPLLFLDIGNQSPGAIDNASSVGLVLHLAECLAQRSDLHDKLRITILIPSAEEMTLMGSAAFVKAHTRQLRQQARHGLFILNFDGIGIDGDLYVAGRSPRRQTHDTVTLLDYMRRACHELRLPLKRFRLVGAMFDHMPFAQHGFDAATLLAVGPASRSVHTRDDSIDKLHVRGFKQAGQVALRMIDLIGE